jgi:hypothetical protein
MKNSLKTVFFIVWLILALIFLTGCVSFPQKNSSDPADSPENFSIPSTTYAPEFKEIHSSMKELPSPELMEQLKSLNFKIHGFNINKWEFGPNMNEITLYVSDINNQSVIEDFQGTHISNYTIRIIHDTEFEKTRDEVLHNLTLLEKDPRYQINTINLGTDPFGIDNPPPGYYAEVWVNELTPENRKMDNTMIQGWRIEIIKPYYTPEDIKHLTKSNSSNP